MTTMTIKDKDARTAEEAAYAAWQEAEEEQDKIGAEIDALFVNTPNAEAAERAAIPLYEQKRREYDAAKERARQAFDAWDKAWQRWREDYD